MLRKHLNVQHRITSLLLKDKKIKTSNHKIFMFFFFTKFCFWSSFATLRKSYFVFFLRSKKKVMQNFHLIHYSFKIFIRFWLAQFLRPFLHNQPPLTIFERSKYNMIHSKYFFISDWLKFCWASRTLSINLISRRG